MRQTELSLRRRLARSCSQQTGLPAPGLPDCPVLAIWDGSARGFRVLGWARFWLAGTQCSGTRKKRFGRPRSDGSSIAFPMAEEDNLVRQLWEFIPELPHGPS